MATDFRGHAVPDGNAAPKRSDLLELSKSINDIRRVANLIEAEQYITDLTAAGLPTAGAQVFVVSENQGYVRVGAGFVRALVDDYSTGTLTPAVVTGTISWQRDGRVVMVRYDLTGVVGSDSEIVALPASIRPTALTPATEFKYGVTDNNPAYLSRVSLRIPGQIGTTRRVGVITYMVG